MVVLAKLSNDLLTKIQFCLLVAEIYNVKARKSEVFLGVLCLARMDARSLGIDAINGFT